MAVRQEVLNVLLAQLLQERGLVAAPEQILRRVRQAGQADVDMPDVVVDFRGLRLVIEGEFAHRTRAAQAAAEEKASHAAIHRVVLGLAHVGVALIYPSGLREVRADALEHELAEATLGFSIITEATEAQLHLFPDKKRAGFSRGKLDDLVEALLRAYDQLVRDEVLDQAARWVNVGLERFVESLLGQPATTERFRAALELRELPGMAEGPEEPGPQASLSIKQRHAINRVSGLIIVNAMVFQEVLSESDQRINALQPLYGDIDAIPKLAVHWQYILNEINYYPIFHIAKGLLCSMAGDKKCTGAIWGFIETCRRIVERRAALRHDLAGRIYHLLLAEAKYLGAFYTSIPAAVLLLKIALKPEAWGCDWADPNAVRGFRVGDLACGTGTLLMASADAILDNHIRRSVQRGGHPDIKAVNSLLVSDVLYGFDVLDSAIHLSASTLAMRNPELHVDDTHLGRRPLGGAGLPLGSLDFIESADMGDLYTQPLSGNAKRRDPRATRLPSFDLCVMNPPFTRSVGGNFLFGHLPENEREPLQRKLKQLVQRNAVPANITAGLGSVFAAIGDKYLREQGRLALVVPRALLSGVAWKRTRELIESHYHLEWIITSHEPDHWNFSENTNLSEVMVIARKRDGATAGERVTCVNLWSQPRNAVEALTVARLAREGRAPGVLDAQGSLELAIGDRKLGEAVSVPWSWLRGRLWGFPSAFAQAELLRVLFHLTAGKLYLPGQGTFPADGGTLPLCPLGELGELGFDCRDIHDGFTIAQSRTAFPAFWSHDARRVTTLRQEPNKFLSPLSEPRRNRTVLRSANVLWQKAGRVLLAERLRLNTMRAAAVRVDVPVLSNVWWTLVPAELTEDAEKALLLWLNSSIGLTLMAGHREETCGAWVKFKKPVLKAMPVLDVRRLAPEAVAGLARAFDRIAQQGLRPFPEMPFDPVRADIDEAIAHALGLPDFGIVRELLANDPILCLSLDRLLAV
ncbi:MAG: hypothetical protein FJ291_29635 [Planctomycetes bacterium]|nr:hypothetical protein [Planctomycetota bacterium]